MSRPYQIFRSPLWKSNFQTPWSPNVIEYSRFPIVHSLIFANIREICKLKLTWQVLTSRDDSFPWQRFFPRLNFCDRFSFAVKSIRDPSFTYGENGIFTFIWLLKASKRWSKTLESLFERGGISRDSGRCWRWWTFGGSFNHSMPLVACCSCCTKWVRGLCCADRDFFQGTSPCNKWRGQVDPLCDLAIFASKSSLWFLRLVPRIQTSLNLWDKALRLVPQN